MLFLSRRSGFNPCSAGFRSETRQHRELMEEKNVSILVLLDSALRRRGFEYHRRSYSRFNPCSAGFRSETIEAIFPASKKCKVSILVLLDSALRLIDPELVAEYQKLFQSLFCWIPL